MAAGLASGERRSDFSSGVEASRLCPAVVGSGYSVFREGITVIIITGILSLAGRPAPCCTGGSYRLLYEWSGRRLCRRGIPDLFKKKYDWDHKKISKCDLYHILFGTKMENSRQQSILMMAEEKGAGGFVPSVLFHPGPNTWIGETGPNEASVVLTL